MWFVFAGVCVVWVTCERDTMVWKLSVRSNLVKMLMNVTTASARRSVAHTLLQTATRG